ncbi:MAG: DUF4326 domain-containing protein [Planctomycetota bacterium]
MRKPRRIRRQRTKGWRKPDGAVFVGRPSRFGNPFRLSSSCSPDQAVERFRAWLTEDPDGLEVARAAKSELRGRDLMCWCRLDKPCHADVLIAIANVPVED